MSGSLSQERLREINEALSEQMGLRFPEKRFRDLERGLLAACSELNLGGGEECLKALRASRLSQEQVERLASHLTVGETYFLREQKSIEALEQKVLPELIALRRGTTRILRFWSAGCSSGEEAYSLAILVQRLLPDWKDWNITILGTDVNPMALQKAERGIYREWSFRGLSSDFKKRYFRPAGERCHQIKDSVKEMVSFAYLNLADESSYPSLATNTLAMDLILCRNVLMYFARDWIEKTTRRFMAALTDGGWVLTSPSEASPQFFPGFKAVNYPGAVFFRKPGGAMQEVQPQENPLVEKAPVAERAQYASRRRSGGSADSARRVSRSGTRREPRKETQTEEQRGKSATEAPAGLPELEVRTRNLANTGNLPEALACCDEALARDQLDVRFHYLKAGILQEMGEAEKAAAVLRKALFVEKNFAMAHFALANMYRHLGKHDEARRHFRRAKDLLASLPPEEVPLEGEGMTARRLCQLAASNLRSLG